MHALGSRWGDGPVPTGGLATCRRRLAEGYVLGVNPCRRDGTGPRHGRVYARLKGRSHTAAPAPHSPTTTGVAHSKQCPDKHCGLTFSTEGVTAPECALLSIQRGVLLCPCSVPGHARLGLA